MENLVMGDQELCMKERLAMGADSLRLCTLKVMAMKVTAVVLTITARLQGRFLTSGRD
jgi:hypothetical protein